MTGWTIGSALRGTVSSHTLIIALSAPLAVAASLSCAYAGGALPTSGQYVAGSGSIGKTGANGLTINQSTNSGIINWNSFSISKGNSVQFNNGSGATLNRVTGGNLSTIAGSLKGTGSIYLINPQGVIVSGTGKVLTGGSFAASTRDVSNSAFMSGSALHANGTSNGNLVNQGQIVSSNGDVTLIGNSVSNSGTVSAQNGAASLNAGNDVLLAPAGSNGRIMVSGGNGDATNSGTISAAQAQLNAAGGNVYALGGNNGGIIRATGTQNVGGHVWLTSGSGNVTAAGNITAPNADGSGGAVTARGNNIVISGSVDTSATKPTMLGGAVSAIAANTLTLSGSIAARGGDHGQGGQIETSGVHVHVADSANVSTLAQDGLSGDWLIDPTDFTIAASGGDMTGATLSSALASGDVTIKSSNGSQSGNGDINVDDNVSWSTFHTLTLDAYRDINFNATVTNSSNGRLSAYVGDHAQGASAGDTTLGGLVFNSGGRVAFTSNGEFALDGANYTMVTSISQLVSDITSNASGLYALAGDINATGTTYTASPIQTIFGGTFEGLGNTISHLTIHDTSVGDTVGLFAHLGGTVRDLTLSTVSITVPGGSQGQAGGLAGSMSGGLIYNVSVSGSIAANGTELIGGLVGFTNGSAAIENSTAGVNITGTGGSTDFDAGIEAGGLVGEDTSSGTISGSSATGNVVVNGGYGFAGGLVGFDVGGSISSSFATGNVAATGGNALAGGFVAYASSSITSSYATGEVTGGGDNSMTGGFIGFQNNGATISGSHATGAVIGTGGADQNVGGFAGFTRDSISNSFATGDVSGASAFAIGGFVGDMLSGTIQTSYATGAVKGTGGDDENVGGFAGGMGGGSLIYDYASGDVAFTAADFSSVGGFIGDMGDGSISHSYSLGDVTSATTSGTVGGFDGFQESGAIDETYESGKVTATAGGAEAGAFTGFARTAIGATTADFYNSTLNSAPALGGGQTQGGSVVAVTGLSSTQMMNRFAFTSAAHGWTDFGTTPGADGWVIVDQNGGQSSSLDNSGGVAGGTTPLLLKEYSTTITNAHQLQLMVLNTTAAYTVGNDFDASGTAGGDVWAPQGFIIVGPSVTGPNVGFSGSLEGNGYSISGFSQKSVGTAYGGMFQYLVGGSFVENLNLLNVSIDNSAVGGGGSGALALDNQGTVKNVHVTGSIKVGSSSCGGGLSCNNDGTIEDSSSAATVSGTEATEVGGLLGGDNGIVEDSFATGAVTVADIGSDAGGLIGVTTNGATVRNSYATGNVISGGDGGGLVGLVQNSTVQTSYSLGKVTAEAGISGTKIGGLVGEVGTGGTVTSSYWDTQTSGQSTSAAGTGKTTAQLQSALPSGFSTTDWKTVAGTTFPYLTWQVPNGTPQAISGTISGATDNTGLYVGLRANGVVETPVLQMGSGAGGYYYDLLAPGSIASTGSDVLAYIEDGSVKANRVYQQAQASLTGLSLVAGQVIVATPAANETAVVTLLQHAHGGTNDSNLLYNTNVNFTSGTLFHMLLSAPTFTFDKSIAMGTGTLDITSTGKIAESGSATVGAAVLTGSSAGGVTLNGANLIGAFDSFANTGGGAIALTDAQALYVGGGGVNAGTGAVTLKTTGASHGLTVGNVVTGSTVTLTSGGTIAEIGSGKISATTLTGASAGGATLNGANVIGTLGAFTNAGAGGLALTDVPALTVSGAVNAGTGTLALRTTGAGHSLSITNALTTTGTASLISAGTLAESGSGKITAAILTGSSAGGATLNGANAVGKLGAFTNTSSGGIALTDTAALYVTGGNVSAGSGNVVLKTTGSGHALNIGSITITGGTVTLASADTINEAGVIHATAFTGSSAGGATLNGANVIGTLGTFANTVSGNIALTDTTALYVNGGNVSAGTGNVTLKTTGAGHALNIGNSVVTGGTVTLTSAGTINEAGAIHAATLAGSSVGGAALNGANLISILGNFANTGAGNFALTDGKGLSINGAISVATGTLGLTTTVGNLAINGSLTAPTVTLNAASEVLEASAGAVTATSTLNVSASTGINLNSTHNHIHAVGTRHTTSGPNVINGVGM